MAGLENGVRTSQELLPVMEYLFFMASNRVIQCCYSRKIAVNISQLRDYRRHSGSRVPDKAFVQGSHSKCVSSQTSPPPVEGPPRSRLSGLIGVNTHSETMC